VTDVLRGRDRPATGGSPSPRPSVVLHATLVALGAALSGLAVVAAAVLVGWVADTRTGASGGDAVRAAADAWLLAHRAGLRFPTGGGTGTVSLVPLGLTALAAVLLHRAGASLARAVPVPDLRAAGGAVAALAVAYGLVAAVVARLAATGTVSASAPGAALGAALLAAGAGGWGVIRGAHLDRALRSALPAAVPAVVGAAAVGAGALLAAGAALVLVSLAVHAGRAGDLAGSLDPGLVGGALLVLACVLLLPNAAVWAAAYAAGPGFAVGTGTAVTPFGATFGPVPALPLLAALPQDDTPPAVVRAVLVLPVLAGVLAGLVLARRLPAEAVRPAGRVVLRTAGWGLLAGLGAAVALAVLAVLAGGSLGAGQLAAVGPSPWQVGLVLALEIGVPAAVTAALLPATTPGE
jgi:hypothetical protein